MSQRSSRSSRLSRAEKELAAMARAAEPPSKDQPNMIERTMQIFRGERKINHVAAVLQGSLTTNVIIVLVMTGVAIASKSLALLSALVENMVDLFVQGLLWYAGTRSGKKQDHAKFPAGTSRFEPVAVIIASSVMVIVSVVFIQEATKKLIDGLVHGEPTQPNLTVEAIVIGGTAVTVKIFLNLYARWVLKTHNSAAVEAIMEDNRNDVVSNSFAIAAYIVASARPELWYVDPAGAILIFLMIMFAWGRMGKEQVMQLVGLCASEEFINEIKSLCNTHNAKMALDIMRAYHFGSKYLVELEVVVPAEMTVKDAHDIALQLQFKVEQHEDVERAFVHVDYKTRDYDEHIVSREEDALLHYAGYSGGETPSSSRPSEEYHPVSQHDEDARSSRSNSNASAVGAVLANDLEEIVVAEQDSTANYQAMKA